MTPTLQSPNRTESPIDDPDAFPYDGRSSGSPLPTPAATGGFRSTGSEAGSRTGSTVCPDCSGETINGAGLFACPDCGWSGPLR